MLILLTLTDILNIVVGGYSVFFQRASECRRFYEKDYVEKLKGQGMPSQGIVFSANYGDGWRERKKCR